MKYTKVISNKETSRDDYGEDGRVVQSELSRINNERSKPMGDGRRNRRSDPVNDVFGKNKHKIPTSTLIDR